MDKQIVEQIETIQLRICAGDFSAEFLVKKSSVINYCNKAGIVWSDIADEKKKTILHEIASSGPGYFPI